MKVFTKIIIISILFSVNLFGQGQQDQSESTGPLIDFVDMDMAMMKAEEKPTVLFFHAGWCPSCKSAAKDFNENANRLENINLIKVDYDNSKELKIKYGITYQHTFVLIDSTGKVLEKWNGGATEELLNKINMTSM